MRIFKRRSSDPNPQLENLSTLSVINGNVASTSRVPSSENVTETKKSNFSGWGKPWEKLKRGDSSEQLKSDRNRKQSWSPLNKENENSKSTSSFKQTDGDKSESRLSQTDLRKIYDMYKSINDNGTRPEKTMKTGRKAKCISENLELSQQQLLDYLIMMKPNTKELDKIFHDLSDDDSKNHSGKLSVLTEEKKSKSKFRSFFSRSNKSDDESDMKHHSKNSSTDSLTSLIHFIKPRRSTSNISPSLPQKFKSDESGYGSDYTKPVPVDSPVSSIKSQLSSLCSNEPPKVQQKENGVTSDYYNEDTDTTEEDDSNKLFTRWYRGTCKKRSRSRSEENDSFSKKKSVRIKRSPSKKDDMKMSVDDLSQNCCSRLSGLKLNQDNVEDSKSKITSPTRTLDKEFKCLKIKVKKDEALGITIGQNCAEDGTSYFIIDIPPPQTAAHRNGNLKLGDEVISLNGIRIKGCPPVLVKNYLVPANGEFYIMVKRLVSETAPKTTKRRNSFLRATTPTLRIPLFGPKKETPSPKKDEQNKKEELNPKKSSLSLNRDLLNPKLGIPTKALPSPKKEMPSVKKVLPSPRKDISISKNGVPSPKKEMTSPKKGVPSPKKGMPSPKKMSSSKMEISSPEKDEFRTNKQIPSPIPTTEDIALKIHKYSLFPNVSDVDSDRPVGLSDILSIRFRNEGENTETSNEEPCDSIIDDMDLFKKPMSPPTFATGMRKFSYSPENYSRPAGCGIVLRRRMENGIERKLVVFCKGPGCKGLGFSVVGGFDSPRGPIGIYIKSIFPGGQAAHSKIINEGDEIVSINGTRLKKLFHYEVVAIFKSIKQGEVMMEIVSRPHAKLFTNPL